jgi:hypothetical protein
MITNNARNTCEIKSRFSMAKAAFNRKKNLLARKQNLNLKTKLVNCCTVLKLGHFGE